jgi:hypothetical protein
MSPDMGSGRTEIEGAVLAAAVKRNKEIERFANVRNNLVLSVLFNCSSESGGQLSNYLQKNPMTKYYSQNRRPDNPATPTEPDNPDKPVDPRPFDPDPSPGDPIVDPADEPLL